MGKGSVRRRGPSLIHLRLLLPALLLPISSAVVRPAVSCSALSSVALNVSWDCVAGSDLYYAALFGTPLEADAVPVPKPVAIVTSTGCSVVVEDLLPATAYFIRARSHRASAPSVARGWRDYVPGVARCTTMPTAPLRLERDGVLAETAIRIRWGPRVANTTTAVDAGTLAVRWIQLQGYSWQHYARQSSVNWGDGSVVDAAEGAVTITGLQRGASYMIVVEDRVSAIVSDPVRFSTAYPGIRNERVYRVAEETDEIDFLPNHNAGDLVGEAAFLSDSGNFVVPPDQLKRDPCAQALRRSSCHGKGGSDCMGCVTRLWENGTGAVAGRVRAQCSDPGLSFPWDNKVAEAFCGAGFGFFDWANTPVTEYCVRRMETPRTVPVVPARHLPGWDVAGFAPYVSCNAPEAGALNSHDNPVCICACYADRLIAMQPKGQLEAFCGAQADSKHPTYHACNCTATGGVRVPNGSSSLTFVGAMEVQCPYFFYSQPVPDYGFETPCGLWVSFPRAGMCAAGLAPGDFGAAGCTWQPHALARNLYGPALLASDWNRSSSFVDQTGARWNDTGLTLANAGALRRAFGALDGLVKSRCCGC